MINVKLIELGHEVKEFSLESGASVSDLFGAAEKVFTQGSATRNQETVYPTTTLRDGDRVFVGNVTKGNLDPFEVSFIRLGGSVLNLPAEDGYTIDQTINQASPEEKAKFFRPDGSAAYQYRVSGNVQPGTFTLNRSMISEGSQSLKIVCSQQVKGN